MTDCVPMSYLSSGSGSLESLLVRFLGMMEGVRTMYQPLADLLRPKTLDEVYGQEHILGKGAILRRLIDSGNIPAHSFVFIHKVLSTIISYIIGSLLSFFVVSWL